MRLCLPLLVVVCALSARPDSPASDSKKDEAKALARKAKRARQAGHDSEAYLLYSQAAAQQPHSKKYKSLAESIRGSAEKNSTAAADVPPDFIPPEALFDSMTAREYASARHPEGPAVLQPTPGLQDFDLNGNARTLFDQVARRFGLQAVFDNDYPTAGPQIRFRIAGIDYREALHDLEAATGSFVVPRTSKLIMVAQDTPPKRAELEQTVTVAIHIPPAMTAQELTELAQAVKQATNVDKLAWDTTQSDIIIRDRVSRVVPAQALFNQLLGARSDVMIDLEFLEVSDSDIKNYGFNVTNSFQAIYLGQILNNAITIPSGISNLLTFGAGKTLIGLSVAQVQAMFNMTQSNSRTLFKAQVRAANGMPSTFHVGEKYPIETSAFAGSATTGTTGTTGTVYAPPPAFTYEDLGVQLKITPHVHGTDEMTLAIETSYELLTGDSVNGLPIIGRRSINSQVRLRSDEWAVVAGLVNPSDAKTSSGFWGLANIPLLGNLFRQTTTDKENTNILIAIRPRLLSLPSDQIVTHAIRVGTDNRPLSQL